MNLFRNITISYTDNSGFTNTNTYITLTGDELRTRIDRARSQQWYYIKYTDWNGKEYVVEKKKDC